ncbi:hypothetical protein BDP27DRAFT_1445253 [Rhodocollybia butyracea]|uniref:Uncharacterized protein n=1 Tax=Rhodocollybia butyracea TaxID=206335 RepID=A0A9P5Q1J9_9AGAR|nr:hypothetical protein BDP27DRAFT_1445253 [Rhodocollybia butyracea]
MLSGMLSSSNDIPVKLTYFLQYLLNRQVFILKQCSEAEKFLGQWNHIVQSLAKLYKVLHMSSFYRSFRAK